MNLIRQALRAVSSTISPVAATESEMAKRRSKRPEQRLQLESLESRELLNGDWHIGQTTCLRYETNWDGQQICVDEQDVPPPSQTLNPGTYGPTYTSPYDPEPTPYPDYVPELEPTTDFCRPNPQNNWCFVGLPYTPPGYSPEQPADTTPTPGPGHNGAKHSHKHLKHAPGDHPFDYGNGHGSGRHKHAKGGFDGSGLASNLRGSHGSLDQLTDNDWMVPPPSPWVTPTPLEQYQQQIDQIIQQQIDQLNSIWMFPF